MKNFFICSTPYQLFNVGNIINTYYKKDTNYLGILDLKYDNTDYMLRCAKSMDIFDVITIINNGKCNFDPKKKVEKMLYYLNCVMRICFPALMKVNFDELDRLFITGTEVFSKIISYYLLSRNNKCNLYYYEDGLASYYDVINYRIYDKKNTILKSRFGYYLIDKCKALFLYNPIYLIENSTNLEIKRIPQITINSQYALSIHKHFVRKKCDELLLENQCVFFDSNFENRVDIEDSMKLWEIIQQYSNNIILVKRHPLSNRNYWDEEKIRIIDIDVGFEIYCLAHSIQTNTLIGIISTACLLPKIVFNCEPKVIMLYKLFANCDIYWKNIDCLIQKIKGQYSEPENFMVPETVEELKMIINKWGL